VKINRNDQIGGQPLKLVRDLLQQCHNGYICIENVVDHLQQNWWHGVVEDLFVRDLITRRDRSYARKTFDPNDRQIYGVPVPRMPDLSVPAKALFNYLLAEGYIELDDAATRKGEVWHRTTIKGQALKMTKLVSRMNRAKADALLKSVLERVAALNADPDMLHWVTEVRVFGSYLTDTDDLGDLDIALDHQQRPALEGDAFDKAIDAFASKHGKQNLQYMDWLHLPWRVMLQRVKARSPYISIHTIDEVTKGGFDSRTVYTFTPPGTHR
jgi:hypothetical protein